MTPAQRKTLLDVYATMQHARVFVRSREIINPIGADLYDTATHELRKLLEDDAEQMRKEDLPHHGHGREDDAPEFHVGDPVQKTGGDYTFDGWVIGVFQKRSGKWRYAVEDDRGIIHIYGPTTIGKRTP